MIVAVDPGRDKIGTAVVEEKEDDFQANKVILKKIIKSEDFTEEIKNIISRFRIQEIVIGSGTASKKLQKEIQEILNQKNYSITINIIEEKYSTREAEKRYKEINPPSGWKKLFSLIFDWKPAEPVDDLAAVVLAEKYIKEKDKNNKK